MALHDGGEHTRRIPERLTWRLALYIRALDRQRATCVVNCESGSAHQSSTEQNPLLAFLDYHTSWVALSLSLPDSLCYQPVRETNLRPLLTASSV